MLQIDAIFRGTDWFIPGVSGSASPGVRGLQIDNVRKSRFLFVNNVHVYKFVYVCICLYKFVYVCIYLYMFV